MCVLGTWDLAVLVDYAARSMSRWTLSLYQKLGSLVPWHVDLSAGTGMGMTTPFADVQKGGVFTVPRDTASLCFVRMANSKVLLRIACESTKRRVD